LLSFPRDINIPGEKTGPRAPATSASNEFVANVTSTPLVRIPNNHFTIMIAPSCQYDNPAPRGLGIGFCPKRVPLFI